MNDFDYDAMLKKRIAQGARHMKRGSRSKQCFLPSDHLTPAQLKRRNGPVCTYKLDRPMTWDAFLGMPEDLKKQYLTNLAENYEATDGMLGELFHVHNTTVGKVRHRLGVPSGGRLFGDQKARRDAIWAAFCNGVVGGGDAVASDLPAPAVQDGTLPAPTPAPASHEDESQALTCAKDPSAMCLTELSAVFSGYFQPQDFLTWIAKLPIPEHEVRIKVEVETV